MKRSAENNNNNNNNRGNGRSEDTAGLQHSDNPGRSKTKQGTAAEESYSEPHLAPGAVAVVGPNPGTNFDIPSGIPSDDDNDDNNDNDNDNSTANNHKSYWVRGGLAVALLAVVALIVTLVLVTQGDDGGSPFQGFQDTPGNGVSTQSPSAAPVPTSATIAPSFTSTNKPTLVPSTKPTFQPTTTFQPTLGVWVEQAKLLAADARRDAFGSSVAISGNRAVVGSPYNKNNDTGNDSGSAYIFVFDGNTWKPEAKLTSDAASFYRFGSVVVIRGDTVIIGATRGVVYVFRRTDGSTWNEQAKLGDASPVHGQGSFGRSIAMDADTIVVGAVGDSASRGAAYVFVRNGDTWSLQAKLIADDRKDGDRFGVGVGIIGNTIVVGADRDDENGLEDSGSAYIFVRTGVIWSQQAKLLAADPAADDRFGISVGIHGDGHGDTVAIGADRDDPKGMDSGSVYIFTRRGVDWRESEKLVPEDGAESDQFGISLSLSAEKLLVGAVGDDSGTGSAYLYSRSGGSWTLQTKIAAGDGAVGDEFGCSVSLDPSSDQAIIGVRSDDDNGENSGSAHIVGV